MPGAVGVHHHGVVQLGGETGAESRDVFGPQGGLFLQLGGGQTLGLFLAGQFVDTVDLFLFQSGSS